MISPEPEENESRADSPPDYDEIKNDQVKGIETTSRVKLNPEP